MPEIDWSNPQGHSYFTRVYMNFQRWSRGVQVGHVSGAPHLNVGIDSDFLVVKAGVSGGNSLKG